MIISIEEARAIALGSQGLINNTFGKGKQGTLNAIEHLGYIQLDTISVVARAHHHSLWIRVKDYEDKHLDTLLAKDKTIFEYWSHAAAYLPMSDFRFSLPQKAKYATGEHYWYSAEKKLRKHVLERIKTEGPLQSRHFEDPRKRKGWWEWKPAKRALEQLFLEGVLMVSKREGFQKVYDLTERVLPKNANDSPPTTNELCEHLIMKAIQAHGLITAEEPFYLRKGLKAQGLKTLKKLLKDGHVREVKVRSIENAFYTSNEMQNLKCKMQNGVHLLSPFDNTIIQRKRAKQLFGFDFMIECYLPEKKRKFGYFCLPILYGDRFVGRLDPKADRAKGVFHVKSFHWESGFKPDDAFMEGFMRKMNDFAVYNGCPELVFPKESFGNQKNSLYLRPLKKRFKQRKQ